MSRLNIWNEKNIKDRISICIKGASTGNYFGGHKSLAEIDLSVYYKGKCSEIMEAFVLKDNTSKTIFKDHIEKAIGNNIANQPLTFILTYGNAKNSAAAWLRYFTHLYRYC